MANRSDMALMVVAWHLVPPWPPTPLALDHGLQSVRMVDGMVPFTRLEHGSLTQSTQPQAHPY